MRQTLAVLPREIQMSIRPGPRVEGWTDLSQLPLTRREPSLDALRVQTLLSWPMRV